jgi:hypothetical protein
MRQFLILAAASCAVAGSSGTALADAPHGHCTVYLDQRIPYVVRQRAVVELHGYVQTGDDEKFDRDVRFKWSASDGAYVQPDANRKGRAFFHPGYRQHGYDVTLQAWNGSAECTPASIHINVDVDYVQSVEAGWARTDVGGPAGGTGAVAQARLVDEFTQLLAPLYLSVDARRSVGTVPAAASSNVEVRLGLKLFDPRIYVGAGHRTRTNLGGAVLSGFGYGAEKLPDIDRGFSAGAFVWYYPTLGKGHGYHTLSYGLSLMRVLPGDRYFVEAGVRREHGVAYGGRLTNFDEVVPFVALGHRL